MRSEHRRVDAAASPAAPDDAAASPQGRLARLPTGFPGQLRFCQDCRPRVGGRTSPVPLRSPKEVGQASEADADADEDGHEAVNRGHKGDC